MNRARYTINHDRLSQVSALLVSSNIRDLVRRLEDEDPQYHSVKDLVDNRGASESSVLAVLNALVSYKLAMRGEDWWRCWSRYHMDLPMRGDIGALVDDEVRFLEECRGAVFQRAAKIKRLYKVKSKGLPVLDRLYESPLSIFDSAGWLIEGLARALSSKPYAKTIVFAAKMAYYVARIVDKRRMAPWDAMIPVDLRVACFLYSTGIIEASSYRDIMRDPRRAQEAILDLAKQVGVPPLNLDTLFWRTGWIPRDLPKESWDRELAVITGTRFPSRLFVRPCT